MGDKWRGVKMFILDLVWIYHVKDLQIQSDGIYMIAYEHERWWLLASKEDYLPEEEGALFEMLQRWFYDARNARRNLLLDRMGEQ